MFAVPTRPASLRPEESAAATDSIAARRKTHLEPVIPDTTTTDVASSSTTEAVRARTSSALKLPKTTFERVREIVDGSRQMNGPASPAVIADQIDKTAKGQNWSDRWSTVQSLGFIAKTSAGKYDISDLGRRFLGEDDADARKAAQEALMRTGFGPLIERFGTGTPNTRAMTNVLASEYGVPQAAAGKSAALLVAMATECGLVVDGRMKPAEIERAQEAAGDQAASRLDPSAAPKPTPSQTAAAKPAKSASASTPSASLPPPAPPAAPTHNTPPAGSTPASASNGGGAPAVPFGLGPTVVLNVDATKLTAAEIGEIVRVLRKAAADS